MNHFFWLLCLAGLVAVGCTSAKPNDDKDVGHDGFELIRITRVKEISGRNDESTFEAVYQIENKATRNLLCLQHPEYVVWEVQNHAGEIVNSTIQSKLPVPNPKNVATVLPGEKKVITIQSSPYKNTSLGFSPRARLVFKYWTLDQIWEKKKDDPLLKGDRFPSRDFSSSWR